MGSKVQYRRSNPCLCSPLSPSSMNLYCFSRTEPIVSLCGRYKEESIPQKENTDVNVLHCNRKVQGISQDQSVHPLGYFYNVHYLSQQV